VSDFEVAQRARNRLSSGADEFSYFLVGQRNLDPRPALGLLYSRGPREQESRELFLSGGGEADGAQLLAGRLVLHGHLSGHAL